MCPTTKNVKIKRLWRRGGVSRVSGIVNHLGSSMLLAHSLFNEGHSFFKCIFKSQCTSRTKCGTFTQILCKANRPHLLPESGCAGGKGIPCRILWFCDCKITEAHAVLIWKVLFVARILNVSTAVIESHYISIFTTILCLWFHQVKQFYRYRCYSRELSLLVC